MSLTAGSTIGPYQVHSLIGRGGMGEVYRATDTKLDREVAIKLLPSAFSQDAERVARFQREAKLLASLSHPNIAAIYGFETFEDKQLLILAFVDGLTLADRIGNAPMAVDEALDLAKQMAEALEAAHEGGVIHRDLKPANIKITPEGAVKVLDFGLAKASVGETSSTSIANSPTLTAEHTRPGVVLGTAAYMSPEQARGKPVDKRTDIWSFGCLLFECLSGERPFSGQTTSDIIAKILERDPDLTALPPNTPPAIRNLLSRCLEKDRRRRLRDIGDAILELDDAISTRAWTTSGIEAAASYPKSAKRKLPAYALGVILFAIGIVLGISVPSGISTSSTKTSTKDPTRLAITLPSHLRVSDARLSPKGDLVTFIGRPKSDDSPLNRKQMLYTRKFDRYEVLPIAGTEGVTHFTFSPDGNWTAFVAPVSPQTSQRRLYKVPLSGTAPPTSLTDWNADWGRIEWLESRSIVALTFVGKKFYRIPSIGGPAQGPFDIETTKMVNRIQELPMGNTVLADIASYGDTGYTESVGLLDLESGSIQTIVGDGAHPRFSPSGHLIFARGNVLMAAPFSLDRLELTGGAMAITAGLRTEESWSNAEFSISDNGTLFYAPGGRVGTQRRIIRINADGKKVEDLTITPRAFEGMMSVSVSGSHLANVIANAQGTYEIWITETDQPQHRRFCFERDADCSVPAWSQDGQQLAFTRGGQNDQDGIYIKSLIDGSSRRVLKRDPSKPNLRPVFWSSDSKFLLVATDFRGNADILVIRLDEANDETQAVPLLNSSFDEQYAQLSPDDQWLAYASNESGKYEIYVAPFDVKSLSLGPSRVVSTDGGFWPKWVPGSSKLTYWMGDSKVVVVDITFAPQVTASQPQTVIDGSVLNTLDAYPQKDGSWIAIQKGDDEGDVYTYHVVLNWLDELTHKLPGAVK